MEDDGSTEGLELRNGKLLGEGEEELRDTLWDMGREVGLRDGGSSVAAEEYDTG